MTEVHANVDGSKVKKLGRGLSALLQVPVKVEVPRAESAQVVDRKGVESSGVAAPVVREEAVVAGGGSVRGSGGGGGGGIELIGLDQIVPSQFQARRSFDETGLRGLTESIRKTGVMQPVIVRQTATAGKYELVAGERRWRAAKIVGLEKMPAIVRPLEDEESAEWGLAENFQREELNPMDRAHGLRMMCDRFGVTHGELALSLGLDRSSIANLVRLTELEADIAELLSGRALTAAHGKALLSMEPGPARVDLAREAVRREWNVRQLTSAVGAVKNKKNGGEDSKTDLAAANEEVSAEISGTRAIVLDLERRLSQQLGTKVEIAMSGSGKKGKIVIEFYGLDHFDGLVGKMGVR